MAANTEMSRLDSLPAATLSGLLSMDADKAAALAAKKSELLELAGKKAELAALAGAKDALLSLAAKSEELLALLTPVAENES